MSIEGENCGLPLASMMMTQDSTGDAGESSSLLLPNVQINSSGTMSSAAVTLLIDDSSVSDNLSPKIRMTLKKLLKKDSTTKVKVFCS